MSASRRILRSCGFLLLALGLAWSCAFDGSLREYLSAHFWLPFAKHPSNFERPHVRRIIAPFAGMAVADGASPIAKLRAAYQAITPEDFYPQEAGGSDIGSARQALATARAEYSLTQKQKEEIDLIDAKIDLRAGERDDDEMLENAKKKLEAFLKTARAPEFRSEARGWLARAHYLLGDQTSAGKIYLDELNRNGSNLSRETLLNSLQMNYGYDGGKELLDHLGEYFDTPEHAAFAIQLVTNPHWRDGAHHPALEREERFERRRQGQAYPRIKELLEKHRNLLESNPGANILALLAMRTALRMGDPPAALKIAEAIPANAAIRDDPDFNWMLASVHFLSREYAASEQPLLALFRSPRSSESQKAAAAYGLCGVYWKEGNVAEQLRFALWLHTEAVKNQSVDTLSPGLRNLSIYWAFSGWDFKLLLDAQAPTGTLQSFVGQNPTLPNIRLVKYSLAVRLTREDRYQEAADIYQSIQANRRVSRIRQLAALYQETNRTGLTEPQRQEAKYKLAEFIGANPNGIYYNDALWGGYQRYALQAADDSRLTRAERQSMIETERKLKDEQEERWRAYLILREVAHDAGKTALGRKAATLAVHCLTGLSDRFERQQEIRSGEKELSLLLRP
jgi:hypothetical protein